MNASTIESTKLEQRIPPEFASLLSALQLSNPNTAQLRKLSDNEWTSLLAVCDLAHLTLQIAQLLMEEVPPWVVERLKTNLADNALRFERVKATYREAAKALDSAGESTLSSRDSRSLPITSRTPVFEHNQILTSSVQPKPSMLPTALCRPSAIDHIPHKPGTPGMTICQLLFGQVTGSGRAIPSTQRCRCQLNCIFVYGTIASHAFVYQMSLSSGSGARSERSTVSRFLA